MAPPLTILLASLAPILLEFDPEQWRAWQKFSTSYRNENPKYTNLLSRLVKAYDENPSEKSPSRVPVLASQGSGQIINKLLTSWLFCVLCSSILCLRCLSQVAPCSCYFVEPPLLQSEEESGMRCIQMY